MPAPTGLAKAACARDYRMILRCAGNEELHCRTLFLIYERHYL
jgi:hypothetical protein